LTHHDAIPDTMPGSSRENIITDAFVTGQLPPPRSLFMEKRYGSNSNEAIEGGKTMNTAKRSRFGRVHSSMALTDSNTWSTPALVTSHR